MHWCQVGLQHLMHHKRSVSLEEHVEGYAAGMEHSQDVHVADGLHAVFIHNAYKLHAACASKTDGIVGQLRPVSKYGIKCAMHTCMHCTCKFTMFMYTLGMCICTQCLVNSTVMWPS